MTCRALPYRGVRHSIRTPLLLAALAVVIGCERPSVGEEAGAGPHEETIELSRPTVDEVSLDSALVLARGTYESGDLNRGRELLTHVASRAAEVGDTAVRAEALTWLSYAERKLVDYEASRLAATEAIELRRAAGLLEGSWRSHNALGLLSWWQARNLEAMEHFDRALEAASQADDTRAVAQVENNRGLVYFDLGELAEARARFGALLDVARLLDDPVLEANGLSNLAMATIALGDPGGAIPSLERARSLYEAAGRSFEVQVVLGQLASAHLGKGDLRGAYGAIEHALDIARRNDMRADEAQNLDLLAAFYSESGDIQRALATLRQVGPIHLELGDDLMAGRSLRGAAELLVRLGDRGPARESALEALELHRGVGAPWEELRDRVTLAEIAAHSGEFEAATRELQEAAGLAARLEAAAPMVEVTLARARLADAREDADGTLSEIARLEDMPATLRYAEEWEAAELAARAHRRLGDFEAAIRHGRRAVALVERVRGELGSGLLRGTLVSARARTYSDLVQALILHGRHAEAFAVADAARGRALAEHLATSGEGRADSLERRIGRGELLLRRISRLRVTLEQLEALPREEIDQGGLEELMGLLAEARREYEASLIGVATVSRPDARVLGLGEIELESVQRSLGPGEVMLVYLATPERLVVFVATNATLSVGYGDVSAETLASRVRLARHLIARGEQRPKVLERLYDEVIGPVFRAAPVLQAERLFIVPHGSLEYLPFAALRDPESGRYLAERYELVHLPSASALPYLDEREAAIESGEGGVSVFAPLTDLLPATASEAEAISRAIPRARVYLKEQASEARLRLALADDIDVHVASHARLTPHHPMFSRVELAGGNGAPRDDAVFELHEVLEQRVRSPLVFLSGCETGLGASISNRFAPGEDYATLALAFLYAGASRVVATLWAVDDEGAAAFAGAFYRARSRGMGASAALAAARRELMSSEDYASPLHWAAYRLSGN